MLEPKQGDKGPRREQVLSTYAERASLRGLGGMYGVARQTGMRWIHGHVQCLPSVLESLLPKQPGDVLELDELWALVYGKANQAWLWTALCRRTRHSVAFVIGVRRAATCRRLWQAIAPAYRRCRLYTDFWRAYQTVLPSRTHHPVGKETGQTAHQERWYNTLRPPLARFVRKPLSFSKSDAHHERVTRSFIIQANLDVNASLTP